MKDEKEIHSVLSVCEACVAIFGPTPGFKITTKKKEEKRGE